MGANMPEPTQPTNSIDSELEEIFKKMLTDIAKAYNSGKDGIQLEPYSEAIKALYRKEVEEAIELLQQPVYSEESEDVDGYMVYVHELRVKLLPPTNTGEKE